MIAWFARNGVAANLLMVLILALGLHAVIMRTPIEVFPEIQLDRINVRIPYRGATPEDVERGVLLRVEEAVHDLQGIDTIRSEAREGGALVRIEVEKGVDPQELLDKVKTRVDAIATFPAQTERPIYDAVTRIREVIGVVVSGDLGERALRHLGERVRDDLIALPGITRVDLDAVRPYEIAIEVAESALHQYGLTFADIADAIRRGSLDLSTGTLRTRGGEIRLRTRTQAYDAEGFASIAVLAREDGARLTVGDLATVRDGFEENPIEVRYDGQPAVMIEVYRVGGQSATAIARQVRTYVDEARRRMPAGVRLSYWRDHSVIVKKRLETLIDSAVQGGILIFLLLALFLRFSVAVWVCIGIPVCFAGALALLPFFGGTINIVSLFAFILVLGVVVDDAIVTAESIYTRLERNEPPEHAVVAGTHDVAVPVTFGILTTIAAFVPLLLVEGVRGKIFAHIPLIVIPVLLFSLIESKLILPAHLRSIDVSRSGGWLTRLQQRVANGLERAIFVLYQPALGLALRHRYLVLSAFIGGTMIVGAAVAAGHLSFVFLPRIQSEVARAVLILSPGTPFELTQGHIGRIAGVAERLRDKYTDETTGESVIRGILATAGSTGGAGSGVAHVGRVTFEIVPPEDRTVNITSSALVREWREGIGIIPGAESLTFRAEIGGGGAPLEVRLSGTDLGQLEAMAGEVRARLADYPGVFDVSDTLQSGKQEIRLSLRPEAELLGLNPSALARQVRQAFFGEEAQRLQRGRDDVRVMVRYPERERRSLARLESMPVRTPSGEDVPLSEIATATLGRGYSVIERVDRQRVVEVHADVNKESANVEAIKRDLVAWIETLRTRYPDVRSSLEGEAREQRESFSSLAVGLGFVLFVVYALLAIPFRSYLQPLIVMSAIPFGVVGAILGHAILGMPLSIMSLMGMLALIGVVVNDSLVLVDYVNRRRRTGERAIDAARLAGVARFRAVVLTSLTTFAGLMPLIFERSTQAQFLIPMAVSLGFGILFATTVTLILVPIQYLVLEDLVRLFRGPDPRGTPARSA